MWLIFEFHRLLLFMSYELVFEVRHANLWLDNYWDAQKTVQNMSQLSDCLAYHTYVMIGKV